MNVRFDRVNLDDAVFDERTAHGGMGTVAVARLTDATGTEGHLHFIDVAVLAPGTSIGRHRHAPDEEEFYLVVEGRGTMWRDGEEFAVRAGDLIRNAAGGAHGLVNSGERDLRLFVFEIGVDAGAAAGLAAGSSG